MNATPYNTIRRKPRSAFTLAELMVVMLVIALLVSTGLFAMYNALEDARGARTRAQVARLHQLVMPRWEAYRTRAIRVAIQPAARSDVRAVASVRLAALRDLMRMELPDRREDVWDLPQTMQYSYNVNGNPGTGTFTLPTPALFNEYRRRVQAAVGANWNNPSTSPWTSQYEGAECLYLIVRAIHEVGSNGLDFLQEGEVGDMDGDGMPEILDGWGNPIQFLRWAPGFVAHPGPDFTFNTADDIPNYSNLQVADRGDSPDPFDPLKIDQSPPTNMVQGSAQYQYNFLLVPLIVSGGPDGQIGLALNDSTTTSPPQAISFRFFRNPGNTVAIGLPRTTASQIPNDPYAVLTCTRRLGEPGVASQAFQYADNITNHSLED